MYKELPIYRDTYVFLVEIYRFTSKMPQEYKYSLGQDLKRDTLNLFRSIHLANRLKDQRSVYLDQFTVDFEMIKIELRLCVDLRVLSIKQLAHLSLLGDTISKQIAGWKKASK
jgi:hypothetical protein